MSAEIYIQELQDEGITLQITVEDNYKVEINEGKGEIRSFQDESLNVALHKAMVHVGLRDKYNIGDKVAITDGEGCFYKYGIVANINEYRPPEVKYALDVAGHEDYLFVGEDNIN